MIISLNMKAEAVAHFPSRFSIGDEVLFHPNTWLLTMDNASGALKARIDKVQFGPGKVTYDLAIQVNDGENNLYFYDAITIKDVDSTFVTTYEEIAADQLRNEAIERRNEMQASLESRLRLEAFGKGNPIPDGWRYSMDRSEWFDPEASVESLTAPTVEAVAATCKRYGFFCARSVFGDHSGQHCKLTLKV